ncbi:MAG: hypothetical protein FD163_1721 [Hyphomonadaceae bacterium]|nr:MAG: hypothetical protein FD128_2703 [Hyphomonadaceae bacterium]KAF0185024.1 MAG: hypothetical protein FD163_1721 [Hyphomonadaceae bacterium]
MKKFGFIFSVLLLLGTPVSAQISQRWVLLPSYDDAMVHVNRNSITKTSAEILIYYRDGLSLTSETAQFQTARVSYRCTRFPSNALKIYGERFFNRENVEINGEPRASQYFVNFQNFGFAMNIYAPVCGAAFGGEFDADERISKNGRREVFSMAEGWKPLKGNNFYFSPTLEFAIELSRYHFEQSPNNNSQGRIADAKQKDETARINSSGVEE